MTPAASGVGARALVGLFLFFLAFYALFTPGHFYSTDEVTVFRATESMIERGSFVIEPVLGGVIGPDGKWYSRYGLGHQLLWVPGYLVGRLVEQHASPLLQYYWSGPPFGQWGGFPRVFFVSLTNLFVTALLDVLIFLFVLRLGFSLRLALVVTFVSGLATGLLVYARESFPQNLEALCLFGAVYVIFRRGVTLRPRDALVAGTLFAYGIFTRNNLLALLPFVLLYLVAVWLGDRDGQRLTWQAPPAATTAGARAKVLPVLVLPPLRLVRPGLLRAGAFLAPLGVVALVMFAANYVRFGSILESGYTTRGEGFTTPLLLGLYGYLFSVGRSIFLYSPPVLLALFGWWRFNRAQPRESMLFAAIALIYLLLYSTWWYWDGGWGWGPRFLLPLVPFLMVTCAYALQRRAGQVAFGVLAALGAVVQLLGGVINWGPIHNAWLQEGLKPENAYLFEPTISPIARHLQALQQGWWIDLWLLWVKESFGPLVFVSTLCTLLLLMVLGVALMRELHTLALAAPGAPATADSTDLSPSSGATAVAKNVPVVIMPREAGDGR